VPVIPSTQQAEIRRITVQGHTGQKVSNSQCKIIVYEDQKKKKIFILRRIAPTGKCTHILASCT
jgi:hypothetical protein